MRETVSQKDGITSRFKAQAIRELNKAYLAQTAVWDGIVPGLDSTAMLFGAQIFGQGNAATPPAQTQVNNNLTQVFGCATVRSLTRHGGPSDGSGTAQAVMSFLGFFLFLYGMTQLIGSVRDCLRQKGFYTPPSSFLFWKLDHGGTSRGDGFVAALQACNQRVVSGPIQINTLSAQDLIRILEDPKACVDFQKKLAFPSSSTQGVGTFVVAHQGEPLPLNHAMTLVNVVCPPHRVMAQFRDPDTAAIVNLTIRKAGAQGEKILFGTLKGIGEHSGVSVDIGLSSVELITN